MLNVPIVGKLFPMEKSDRRMNPFDIDSIFRDIKQKCEKETELFEVSYMDDFKGRKLVAEKDYLPGEVILTQKPILFQVPHYSRNNVCNYTLQTRTGLLEKGKKLLREGQTKDSWFAGKPELKLAWQDGHQEHVESVNRMQKNKSPIISSKNLADVMYFVGRMYRKLIGLVQTDPTEAEKVYDLFCPLHLIPHHKVERCFKVALSTIEYLELNNHHFEHNVKFLTRLVAAMEVNSKKFNIYGRKAEALCLFVAPVALINHNFSPNAKQAFDFGAKNLYTLFASKKINVGDEITVCYTPTGDLKCPRFQQLLTLQNQHCMDPFCHNLPVLEQTITFKKVVMSMKKKTFKALLQFNDAVPNPPFKSQESQIELKIDKILDRAYFARYMTFIKQYSTDNSDRLPILNITVSVIRHFDDGHKYQVMKDNESTEKNQVLHHWYIAFIRQTTECTPTLVEMFQAVLTYVLLCAFPEASDLARLNLFPWMEPLNCLNLDVRAHNLKLAVPQKEYDQFWDMIRRSEEQNGQPHRSSELMIHLFWELPLEYIVLHESSFDGLQTVAGAVLGDFGNVLAVEGEFGKMCLQVLENFRYITDETFQMLPMRD